MAGRRNAAARCMANQQFLKLPVAAPVEHFSSERSQDKNVYAGVSQLSAACRRPAPLIAAPKHGRRWAQIPRPDRSVVEMDGQAIRRIDGALVPGVDPDPRCRCKPVRPCAGGLTDFVEKIDVGSVLGDESGTADASRLTHLDAPICAGQID